MLLNKIVYKLKDLLQYLLNELLVTVNQKRDK